MTQIHEVLKKATEEEINSRRAEVIYRHNCWDYSKYHLRKYKHWAKVVHAVDTSRTNGYAWQGSWLRIDSDNLVPQDSLVVEFCGDENRVRVYRAIADGQKELIGQAKTNQQVELIRKVADLLQKEEAK
jgi:hypothetical protein